MNNARKPNMMGAGGKSMPRGIAPNLLPGVTHEHLTPILCKCGGMDFLQVTRLGYASKFHTVNGIPTLVSLPLGYACLDCSEINDYDHPDLQKPEENEEVFKCPKCASEGFEPSESGDSCFHCDNKAGEKKEAGEEKQDFETFRDNLKLGEKKEYLKDLEPEKPGITFELEEGKDLGIDVAEEIKTKEVLK